MKRLRADAFRARPAEAPLASRDEFLTLFAHEVRAPIAAVAGAAHALEHRWRALSDEQRDSLLAVITSAAERLAALVEDVRDPSAVESGQFAYRFQVVDAAAAIRSAAAAASVLREGVRVRAHACDELPEVLADPGRLAQALANLLDNAVAHSPDGGSVDVGVHASGGRVRIEVSDEGPGIPPEHQERVFAKFARAGGRNGGKAGNGLGLFVARSIAEAHGGSLTVRSAPGEGSTFTLELPSRCPA